MLDIFIRDLYDSGQVTVVATEVQCASGELHRTLTELEALVRLDLPMDPPALDLDVAAWAVEIVYRACRFLTHCHLDVRAVDQGLHMPCPSACNATIAYAADIALRFLPDVYTMARNAAADDPLVEVLHDLAAAWPLSSVGIPDCMPDSIDDIWTHPCLRRMYVDRVIAQADKERLADARVSDAVRAALGCHPELSPDFKPLFEEKTHAA